MRGACMNALTDQISATRSKEAHLAHTPIRKFEPLSQPFSIHRVLDHCVKLDVHLRTAPAGVQLVGGLPGSHLILFSIF